MMKVCPIACDKKEKEILTCLELQRKRKPDELS